MYCNNVTILERYNFKRVRIYVILTIWNIYICIHVFPIWIYNEIYLYICGIHNMPHYFYTGIQLFLLLSWSWKSGSDEAPTSFLYVTFSKLKIFYLLENVFFSLMVVFFSLNVYCFKCARPSPIFCFLWPRFQY